MGFLTRNTSGDLATYNCDVAQLQQTARADPADIARGKRPMGIHERGTYDALASLPFWLRGGAHQALDGE